MSTPLPQLDDINGIPTVCRLLRTKHAFGTFAEGDFDPWQTGESTTAVFWCLATMQSSGPDDSFAHPTRCRSGRECYRTDE
jgi:hypothetical protein